MGDKYTKETIFDAIARHTLAVAEVCAPTNMLFLAVDGVAPRAKIHQQRKRRYMTAYRNGIIQQFKKDNNIPTTDWDSNCITPGTSFMKDLDEFLHARFDRENLPFKIVISGHDEKGEGEHKIIWYIKDHMDKGGTPGTQVIYGLDADLIMLSLGCKAPNIYLMRESQEGKGGLSTCKFLNIDTLRKCVSRHIVNKTGIDCDGDDEDTYDQMYDYIFICFMLGNDFLPNLPFLHIKNGAVDILCSSYQKVRTMTGQTAVIKKETGYEINHAFLTALLELLSKLEDNGLKEAIEQHDRMVVPSQRRFHTKLDKFAYELENTPLFNKFPPQLITPHHDVSWRNSYNHYLFGNNSQEIIKEAALTYIQGLLWTANYYFNMEFDEHWHYPFDYSPCVTDIYKYICISTDADFASLQKRLRVTVTDANSGIHIDSTIQLLMVLPPQSKQLVPKVYQPLVDQVVSGCVHYFPTKFRYQTFLKTQLWECIPMLPPIDLEHLYKKVRTVL